LGRTTVKKKSRILYVKQFLETQTDENHPATLQNIIDYLVAEEIYADRRTVADDVKMLEEFGVDVVCDKGHKYTYFVGTSGFELSELKMLIDAVQASRVIPLDKAAALIAKLTTRASVHQASELNRQLYTYTLPDDSNRAIMLTIDVLFTAINTGMQVAFKYYEYKQHKTKEYKHGKKEYRFSPYGMLWNGGRHYAVGYEDSHKRVVTFRIDRIAAIKLSDTPIVPPPNGFDMYDGEIETVTLLCENAVMKSIIDRFGVEVKTEINDAEHFTAVAEVSVSPTFYGWVFSFGGKIRITAPEGAVNTYKAMAEKSIKEMA
jgi:predicted DNA-binding transcriptional regulator YafY